MDEKLLGTNEAMSERQLMHRLRPSIKKSFILPFKLLNAADCLFWLFLTTISCGVSAPTYAVPGAKKWVFDTGAAVRSSPALGKGLVYFGASSGKVYALEVATGQPRWE